MDLDIERVLLVTDTEVDEGVLSSVGVPEPTRFTLLE